MNTYRYTPQLIVDDKNHLCFNIPLYQRLFSWGEEQVRGLMLDLKEHFASTEDDDPYYLGMLSCIGKENEYDLIDGQQRFTVMTLLAIVLREFDSRWNDFLNGGRRLNFVARPKDREYLLAAIGDVANHVAEPNERMASGINAIKTFMNEEFDTYEERCIFASNTFERLSFFFSVLPVDYLNDPMSLNKYFEAMNAGGKGLEQHEILKVQLMRGETGQEKLTRIWNSVSEMGHLVIKKREEWHENDYQQQYRNAINLCRNGRFDEAFSLCESSYDSEDDVEIGMIAPVKRKEENKPRVESDDQSILTFPEFLMLVLDIYQQLNGSYSFYRTDLLSAFVNYPLQDVHSFYNTMLFYRLLFDYYIITKEESPNGNKYEIVARVGNEFEVDCVRQYESMLYVSNTPYYNWLKPLLIQLAANPVQNASELLSMLKDIDNSIRKFPSSVESLSYDNSPDRYWFWRLDYYLWEKKEQFFEDVKDQEIVRDYVFRANRSLEHLHPQHQENNAVWDDDNIHSFGNLAMISQSFNSQQSDDPVTVKFARISDQAQNHALQSLKLYRMYLDAKGNPDGWTVEKMEVHKQKMYELLKITYPSDSLTDNLE